MLEIVESHKNIALTHIHALATFRAFGQNKCNFNQLYTTALHPTAYTALHCTALHWTLHLTAQNYKPNSIYIYIYIYIDILLRRCGVKFLLFNVCVASIYL